MKPVLFRPEQDRIGLLREIARKTRHGRDYRRHEALLESRRWKIWWKISVDEVARGHTPRTRMVREAQLAGDGGVGVEDVEEMLSVHFGDSVDERSRTIADF